MSVNSYLETLASSLVLNSTEKNHITIEYEEDKMPYSALSEIKKAFPEV